MKLSVIIANYNHADFIGSAISSALAIDWPEKEVIVVDDASTDGSRLVIERFSGKVAAYFRPKSHQLGAHMFGFEQSTGDIIIFLDADDLLEPEVMREVAKVWRPDVSKVQFRMNLIDASNAPLGSAIPQFPRERRSRKAPPNIFANYGIYDAARYGQRLFAKFRTRCFRVLSIHPPVRRRTANSRTNYGRCLDHPKAVGPV